ncbi:MAG: family 1 glycosylhydrolase [Microcella sp.]|uniref:family 1 glycosylhydrolase n=1 Tax=Microcella sp. TaxID=1913979 RepID=UPI0033150F52
MNLYLDLDFRKAFAESEFFFGVANAPYLCEGGFNTPGGPQNSMGYFEESGLVPPSGETTSYWTTYQEHIDLARSHGLTAFRTGVEWARIQPTTELREGPEPSWDPEAVETYAAMLHRVQEAGMVPIVTLHHFTHPAWLGPVFWDQDDSPERALAFELRIVEELNTKIVEKGGTPLSNLITFNELNLLPWKVIVGSLRIDSTANTPIHKFPAVFDNVLCAHVQVYDAILALYESRGWQRPQIGFGTATQSPYEFDKLMLDVVRLRSAGVARADVAAHLAEQRQAWLDALTALARRQLTDSQMEFWLADVRSAQEHIDGSRFERTLEALYQSKTAEKLDFISANIYEPFRNGRAAGVASQSPRWWEFAADGDIYYSMIHAYNHGNTTLPMYMGENSLAYEQPFDGEAVSRPDGWTRERYFKTYFMEMVRCIAEGVPIKGYLYWSLVDDFEWDAGFTPRLGLHNYDYPSKKIRETDGLGENSGYIYQYLIAALRSGDKQRIREAFVNTVPTPPM